MSKITMVIQELKTTNTPSGQPRSIVRVVLSMVDDGNHVVGGHHDMVLGFRNLTQTLEDNLYHLDSYNTIIMPSVEITVKHFNQLKKEIEQNE